AGHRCHAGARAAPAPGQARTRGPGRISVQQVALDAFGNAVGESLAAASMGGGYRGQGTSASPYVDPDTGEHIVFGKPYKSDFPQMQQFVGAVGDGSTPPVDRSNDVLLAAGHGFTMGRGPVSIEQRGRTVYITEKGVEPSVDAMLAKAQADMKDLDRLRDEEITSALNRNSVIRETVTPIFEPFTTEAPPMLRAIAGGVGDVVTGTIVGLADLTVAPLADLAQTGLKALHGAVTGDYQPLTPLSSYADGVVNGGMGTWDGIKATGVSVFNVSPLGMVYHAGTGAYGLTTAAMNGDVRGLTRESLWLGLNFAGAAVVPMGMTRTPATRSFLVQSETQLPFGGVKGAATSRMSELQSKWGDLTAGERRALLESKSEVTWSNWLNQRYAAAKAVNPKTHFLERHGPGTELLDQEIRASSKLAPDGSIDKAFRDSTRFLSNRDMGAAMQRADSIFQLNGGVNKVYSFKMEGLIGEGYTKSPGLDWMFTTNVNAVFRNGQPYTMFPLLRPIP
ncbi:hypothetical protein, partial [Paracidovorax cattleyae]|uniref:hypothetical protein n=1 Tax=Paracidovorax cattleyae TaxID=80868 RepID=UPI00366B26D6